jgi:hypothetical protein
MTPFHRDQGGGVAAMAAVSLLILATLTAAAVNLTRITSAGGELQDLADAAALNAAMEIREGKPQEAAMARVEAMERPMQAAMAEGAELSLVVNAADPANVTVTGRQNLNVVMGGLLGLPQARLSRSATAIADQMTPVCLLLLEPSAPGAWALGGSSKVSARDCVGQVNSSATGAIQDQGAASASMLATHVVGAEAPLRRFYPEPQFGQRPLADPFAGKLPWPAPGAACAPDKQNVNLGKGSAPLSPGVYCGGLSFGSGARAVLKPGVYVIATGGIDFDGNAEAEGLGGVTLILLDPAGALRMSGNSALRVTAPTTGPWAGIALAQRPVSTAYWTMTGSSRLELQGVAYLPSQTLSMTGSSSLGGPNQPRAIVARRLITHGSADVDLVSGPGLPARAGGVRLAS